MAEGATSSRVTQARLVKGTGEKAIPGLSKGAVEKWAASWSGRTHSTLPFRNKLKQSLWQIAYQNNQLQALQKLKIW